MNKSQIAFLALSMSDLAQATERLSQSFESTKAVFEDLKARQPIEESKSRYINKPRYNFKRR